MGDFLKQAYAERYKQLDLEKYINEVLKQTKEKKND